MDEDRRSSQRFYLLDGHTPVPTEDFLEWTRGYASTEHRVAYTEIGRAYVSTIFLGVANLPADPPLLFETLIFGGKHDRQMWRYATWEEAEQGHTIAVALVRGGKRG